MKNADVLNILNEISNFLDREEYYKATEYIEKKKNEIKLEKDPSSEYMDKLIKDLKWKSKCVEIWNNGCSNEKRI